MWPDRVRILASYYYFKDWTVDEVAPGHAVDLLIDSGAFSAHTQGAKISLNEYADWLRASAHRITAALTLDVIGDHLASARNTDRLQSMLGDRVTILPAWHLGSPWEELRRLCREHDYVAIGGAVPHARRVGLTMQFMIKAHQIAAEHGTRLHGLGVTGPRSMGLLPWHSVDSSGWVAGHRFGVVALADRSGKRHQIKFGLRPTPKQATIIRHYDGNPARIAAGDFALVGKTGDLGKQERAWTAVSSARSLQYIEGVLRRRHSSALGIYFVDTTNHDYLRWLIEAHDRGTPW